VLQVGDPEQLEQVREKFDIQNARKRDTVTKSTHTYNVKASNHGLNKRWKDSASGSTKGMPTVYSKIKPPPVIIQYQQALINEKIGVSPFLQELQTVEDVINHDRPLAVSQSVKVIPGTMLDPIKPEHLRTITQH